MLSAKQAKEKVLNNRKELEKATIESQLEAIEKKINDQILNDKLYTGVDFEILPKVYDELEKMGYTFLKSRNFIFWD